MNYQSYPHNDRNITIVDMRHHYAIVSELTMKGIHKYIQQGKKIGIILNKTGYYTSIMCRDCGETVYCDQCHLPLAIHGSSDDLGFSVCHCCRSTYDIPDHCKHCHGNNLQHRGMWLEQLAWYIREHTDVDPVVIQSSNTNSARKSNRMYDERDTSQIIIWTSLIATGNPTHQFDLLIYLNADQWLSKPDFNASFDTFYSVYDGVRQHPHANVVLQSYSPDHQLFQYIGSCDEAGFVQRDQSYKRTYDYPPYSQVCVLMYKHEVQSRVYRTIQKLYNELSYLKEYHKRDDIQLYQTPPLVFKKYGKYHYHIILKWPEIRSFVDLIFPLCKIYERGFKVDWEPRNLV